MPDNTVAPTCRRCGAVLADRDRFCVQCGAPVHKLPIDPAPAEDATTVDPAVIDPPLDDPTTAELPFAEPRWRDSRR